MVSLKNDIPLLGLLSDIYLDNINNISIKAMKLIIFCVIIKNAKT